MTAPVFFVLPPQILRPRQPLHRSAIILVEGMDEMWFLDTLLEYMGVQEHQVQVIDYGGINKLEQFLVGFFKEDYVDDGGVAGLLVTADADRMTAKQHYDLNKHFKDRNCSLPEKNGVSLHPKSIIKRVGYFLTTATYAAGNLDSMMLETVADNTVDPKKSAAAQDAKMFIDKHHSARSPENDKRIVQAYLASQDKISRGAGYGARNGYFDLDHAVLAPLKAVIKEVIG